MANSSTKTYFPALTGLRVVAATLVFCHHYNPFSDSATFLHGVFNQMYIGVTIFFVLSGFLIEFRYGEIFEQPGQFWRKTIRYQYFRFARIWPTYLLFTIIVLWRTREPRLAVWFTNLTLTKGLSNQFIFTGIAQSWSITVEEMFYFAAPILIILSTRFCSTSSLKLGRSPYVPMITQLIGFSAAIAAIGAALAWACAQIGLPFLEEFKFVWLYTFFGRSFEFLVGFFLSKILRHTEQTPAGLFNRKNNWHLTTLAILCLAGSMLLLAVLQGSEFQYGHLHPLGMVFHNFVLPLFVGLLLLGLLTEATYFSSILGSRPLQILGFASYSFYLLHFGLFAHFTNRILSSGVFPLFIALQLLSCLSFYGIEKPINQWLISRVRR